MHLIVAGDGDLRESLCNRAGALGLSSRVHFLGVRRDVGDLLNAMTCSCSHRFGKGFRWRSFSQWERGYPVVASNVAGVPEVVEDGRTGLLVPPADREALGRALAHLVTDPQPDAASATAADERCCPRFGVGAAGSLPRRRFNRSAAGGDELCDVGREPNGASASVCGSGAAQALKPGKLV